MKKRNNLLMLILGGLGGGAVGALMAMHTDTLPQLLVGFVLLFLAVYAQLILHEAGHLIAGLLTGYRFVSFRIGSLMLLRRGGRFVWARYRLAGTGGQCLMAPPELKDGAYPNGLYHLGGAAMNLLWAALAGGMLIVRGYSAWWLGTLMAGLVMGLSNGLPLKMSGLDNDGRNALRSRRDSDVRMGFYRQLQVNAALSEGKRLRDLPAEWFDCAPGQEYERGYLRFQWLLDREEYDAARAYGQGLADDMPGVHRALLENDLRCLALLAGEQPTEFSEACKRLVKAMGGYPSILRAQYLFALLQEGDRQKAEAIREKFDRVLKSYPYPGDVQTDIALMRLATQKYDNTSVQNG